MNINIAKVMTEERALGSESIALNTKDHVNYNTIIAVRPYEPSANGGLTQTINTTLAVKAAGQTQTGGKRRIAISVQMPYLHPTTQPDGSKRVVTGRNQPVMQMHAVLTVPKQFTADLASSAGSVEHSAALTQLQILRDLLVRMIAGSESINVVSDRVAPEQVTPMWGAANESLLIPGSAFVPLVHRKDGVILVDDAAVAFGQQGAPLSISMDDPFYRGCFDNLTPVAEGVEYGKAHKA